MKNGIPGFLADGLPAENASLILTQRREEEQ